jgi:hypothetical protein
MAILSLGHATPAKAATAAGYFCELQRAGKLDA